MLLAEPPPSPGDLHFRVLGIPVRVHPFFWLGTIFLELGHKGGTPPMEFLLWVVVVFCSILAHELGHALTQRHFGGKPWITLHGFGGLASCGDCDRSPRSQILISLAGPAAGFVVAAITFAVMRFTGHIIGWTWAGDEGIVRSGALEPNWLNMLGGRLYWDQLSSSNANTLLSYILQVNIMWGLINLLPVYPLDGGQVSRELCTLGDPRRGILLSLQISIVVAAGMAVVGLIVMKSVWVAFLFGYLAYGSYRALEAYRSSAW